MTIAIIKQTTIKKLLILLGMTCFASMVMAQQPGKWGDQHNGTYVNPILPGDFQNTDVIRVGSIYYNISATKQLSPGMVILSSTDLVNWVIIGHAVNDITEINPRYNYDKMDGPSRGIWAGSISYHDNKFWVYFTDPDYGLFMTTAVNPAGPWKPITALLSQPGWDDPCPIWDEKGQGYLVITHFADDYKIHLFEMSTNGQALLMDSDKVIHQSKGSEANKMYHINNYYYHFYSEVTAQGRMPFMERSLNITGPYTERKQLIHKAEADPNQGGMVQTLKGDWYFVTHHGKAYWDGREASLLPVTWIDGWPVWGKAGADGIGNMVWDDKMPEAAPSKSLQTGDEFNAKVLAPQWEWYFQPRGDKWSLKERPGFMRLYACKPLQPGLITKSANVLTQRPLRSESNTVTVKIDISNMADGQVTGLSLFGKTYGVIGVMQRDGSRKFCFNNTGKTTSGPLINSVTANIYLRAIWDVKGLAQFYYSTDGKSFEALGDAYQITNFGNYLGAKLGLYTANDEKEDGYVDIDWFHYDVK